MIILLTTFLLTSGSVENDRLKGINIPSHTNARLVAMKIWKAKCIVQIYREQIGSKFSINCAYKPAFVLAKAPHNPAMDESDQKKHKETKHNRKCFAYNNISYYRMRNALFLE